MEKLIHLTKEHEKAYFKFISYTTAEDIVPWAAHLGDLTFDAYLVKLKQYEEGLDIPEDKVSATTLFYLKDDEIIGAIDIRHKLNAHLLQSGGHIGYGIIPPMRHQGYATKMLKEGLKYAKSIGLDKVLVVCDEVNTASEKTILKCGGVLEDKRQGKNEIVKRFWITT